MGKKIISLILALVITVSPVYAQEINLETIPENRLNLYMVEITNSIIYGDFDSLVDMASLFSGSALSEIQMYISSDNYENTIPGGMIMETVKVQNSSTGDMVVFIDSKQKLGETIRDNTAMIYEYHIDANGKIYGFNAWRY